jgi:hypothetical protein
MPNQLPDLGMGAGDLGRQLTHRWEEGWGEVGRGVRAMLRLLPGELIQQGFNLEFKGMSVGCNYREK